MASEATAGDQAEEEYQEARLEAGVDIPTTSAMYKQLQRLAIRFYSRSEESAEGKKYEWRGQQDEDERIDDEIDKLLKHRDVAGRYAHREFGRDKWRQIKSKGKVHEVFVPKFEYFNLVGDDELEAATDRLVNDYVKYHKKQGKGFEPTRLGEWESKGGQTVPNKGETSESG